MRAFIVALLLALFVSLSIAPDRSASQPQTGDPADERATEFRAVEGPQVEDVPGGPLLITAYGVVWVLLMLYLVRLGRMQARIARDLGRLERSLAADATATDATQSPKAPEP